jgi:putative oxidoreductase
MAIIADVRPRVPLERPGEDFEDTGKLLLRLTLGLLLLLHGIGKLTGGVEGIIGAVARTGLPGSLGYLVYVGEIVAPLLLIFGIWTRMAAVVIAINMVVAVVLMHMGDLATLTESGGWKLELQAFYLATAFAIALLGAGRLSFGGSEGRWN